MEAGDKVRRGTVLIVARALMDAADAIQRGRTPDELRKQGAERRAADWQRRKARREAMRLGRYAPTRDDVWADPSALMPVRRALSVVS